MEANPSLNLETATVCGLFHIIPTQIHYDASLTPHARLLYGTIASLAHKTGFCYATNKALADLYAVNPRKIRDWLASLRDAGYIEVDISDNFNRKLRVLIDVKGRPFSAGRVAENIPAKEAVNGQLNKIKNKELNKTDWPPLPFKSEAFKTTWNRWRKHLHDKKRGYSRASIKETFDELERWGETRSIRNIEFSIKKNWNSIYEPKATPCPPPKQPNRNTSCL